MGVVRQAYDAELAARGFSSDHAQLRAIEALDRCASEWADFKAQRSNAFKKLINRPEIPRGVYMYGGVGRGKSFLMDCFYNAVPLRRKTRLHFHEFMREVHRELAELQGTVNPLDELGLRISKRYRLICFDEFHVADITDAMILHRLLAALFENGVGFVTTSNFKPDDLYPGGLHRDRILPAIALLNERLEVISVDNGTDYRRRTLEQVRLYLTPNGAVADKEMRKAFERLAESADENPVLHIESREIHALRKAGGVVWFDFKTLCGGPRSQNDYLEISPRPHPHQNGTPLWISALPLPVLPPWMTGSRSVHSSAAQVEDDEDECDEEEGGFVEGDGEDEEDRGECEEESGALEHAGVGSGRHAVRMAARVARARMVAPMARAR